jgi:hypothetical protein
MPRGDGKRKGEGHYLAKLDDAAVIFIRKSDETISHLARTLKVSRPTLRSAKSGRTCKHLGEW